LSFPWKKEYRVLKSTDFRFIQRNGRKWKKKDLLFIYIPSLKQHSRVGFVVSKKVGCAVIRNQVKRCLREATRHHYSRIKQGTDIVIIAFPSAANSTSINLNYQISSSFDVISKRI
jgi:ribonuclease P protein component